MPRKMIPHSLSTTHPLYEKTRQLDAELHTLYMMALASLRIRQDTVDELC